MADPPAATVFQHGAFLNAWVYQCSACRYTTILKSSIFNHLKTCPGGEVLWARCTLPVLELSEAAQLPPPPVRHDSVEAFLASPTVVLDKHRYCPLDDFKAALRGFESRNGFASKRYGADFFDAPFAKFGLHVRVDKLFYRDANRTREYLIGADLAEQPDDDLDSP